MSLRKISGMLISLISLVFATSLAHAEVQKPQLFDGKAAIVNDSPIYKEELDGEVLSVQKQILAYGKPLTVTQVAAVQKQVLESLIRRELLYQESRKAGIKADEKKVADEMEALKKQFQSEADYKNELSGRNMTEEMLRSRLKRNNSLQQYFSSLAAKLTVSDDDAIAYYRGHLDLFRQPLQMRVSHILIQSDPGWEASRRQEARRKAEQIAQALKKGKDFAAIAREQSDGPTRTNGGDLGYIRMGQLDKQLESVVFGLNTGEISDIVETDYGFHLFKAMDKKSETVLAYEEVKEKIREFLREEKAKRDADLQAGQMREKARVEILVKEEGEPAK